MLQTITRAEVLDWYRANMMPSPSRRKIGFWVVGEEGPGRQSSAGTVVALDAFRRTAQLWPLTKDATHPIIAAAFA